MDFNNFDIYNKSEIINRDCFFKKKCGNSIRRAIIREHALCLQTILENIKDASKLNMNAHNKSNQTPLTFAITHLFAKNCSPESTVDIIKILLENGCNINSKGPGGNTPLHLAVIYTTSKKIFDTLLYYNPNPFIKNNTGETPTELYNFSKHDIEIIYLLENYEKNFEILIKEPHAV
jgi:ankyrin repeat protein